MERNEELLRKMRAGKFVENNGRVMRTINILRDKYVELKNVKYALPDIEEAEIIDSVNFLQEEGYIRLRTIETKDEVQLADADYRMLEAKVTGTGIRLLGGGIQDNMVDV